MKKLLLISCCFILNFNLSNAQYREFTLQEKVDKSDLIIEGVVTKQHAYKRDGLIYTANQVEICDVIFDRKNSYDTTSNIIIITYGGHLGEEFNNWTHMLDLYSSFEGLFFLKENPEIEPEVPATNTFYYEVYGQEQGAISYIKGNSWDFSGNALFVNITDPNLLIEQIVSISNQSLSKKSCILDEKSGVVLKIDTMYLEQENIVIHTAIKGQWSKEYNLENAKIRVEFSSPINLGAFNFSISALNPSLQSNYLNSWVQPQNELAELNTMKNPGATEFFKVNNEFSEFLKITFNKSLLLEGVKSIKLVECSYKQEGEIFNFEEYDFVSNEFIQKLLLSPDMKSFQPKVVCAGTQLEQSLGEPSYPGYVIIRGENFGDIENPATSDLILEDYRVEFTRVKDNVSNPAHKVTPPNVDYEYWTDTEIRVKVPTVGWAVNGNNLVEVMEQNVASTGRVTVRTPLGKDDDPEDQVEKELVVKFAQFSLFQDVMGVDTKVFPRKLINHPYTDNGGYYFVFHPSFDGIYPYNPSAAKQDVIEAFCEWNAITEAQLEVVDVCPTGQACYEIKYEFLPTGSGSSSVVLGAAQSGTSIGCSNNQAIVNGGMELIFNTAVNNPDDPNYDPWVPLPDAGFDDRHIIRTTAYHEIGHLLQLGHVYGNTLMNPLYHYLSTLDSDAVAGGTHVSNASASMNCDLALEQGIIENCINPVFNHRQISEIKISPNPVNEKLFLKTNLDLSSFEYRILDVFGSLKTHGVFTSNDFSIHIGDFLPGTYFLILEDATHIKTLKFSKI